MYSIIVPLSEESILCFVEGKEIKSISPAELDRQFGLNTKNLAGIVSNTFRLKESKEGELYSGFSVIGRKTYYLKEPEVVEKLEALMGVEA